jgi:hypothetical protein
LPVWLTVTVLLLVVFAIGVAGALVYGASRWQDQTKDYRTKLEAVRLPPTSATYDARDIEGLPPPVRRYFHAVLQDGQPIVTAVKLSQAGQFRLDGANDGWRPFKATQAITTHPPSFDWDARIRMAPGIHVFVRDAYTAGVGRLHAALLSLVTVADLSGTPELASGELLRYLAEAAWYPTALLPSQGVHWDAIDDSTARANLADGAVRASLEFHFDKEGLITAVWAPVRYRTVNGALQPTPWQGRFSAYAPRGCMRIPLEGEVEWQLPTGPSPYWRGRITEIAYELAG